MHHEAGLTLIEVTIAAMMLAVALVALGGMQVVGIHLNTNAKRTTQMAVIAQQTLETLLALPYNDAMLQDHTPTDLTTKTTYTAPHPPQGHTVQWTVNDRVLTPQCTIKVIDITVTHKSTGQHDKTLMLSGARSNL